MNTGADTRERWLRAISASQNTHIDGCLINSSHKARLQSDIPGRNIKTFSASVTFWGSASDTTHFGSGNRVPSGLRHRFMKGFD